MKIFKFLILINVLVGWNMANATKRQLDFSFTVNSSGADFWVCQAGLKHPPKGIHGTPGYHGSGGAGTGSFTPTGGTNVGGTNNDWEANPGCAEFENCEIVTGTHKQDYMVVKYCDWDGNDWTVGTDCVNPQIKAIGASASATGFATVGAMPIMSGGNITNAGDLKEVRKLTFNLASDTYGAHYFVKLCFWASEIPHPGGLQSEFYLDANFSHIAHVGDNNDYAIDSQLGWKERIDCGGSLVNEAEDDGTFGNNGTTIGVTQATGNPVKMCSVTYEFWEENNTMMRPHALKSDKFLLWAGVEQNFIPGDVAW